MRIAMSDTTPPSADTKAYPDSTAEMFCATEPPTVEATLSSRAAILPSPRVRNSARRPSSGSSGGHASSPAPIHLKDQEPIGAEETEALPLERKVLKPTRKVKKRKQSRKGRASSPELSAEPEPATGIPGEESLAVPSRWRLQTTRWVDEDLTYTLRSGLGEQPGGLESIVGHRTGGAPRKFSITEYLRVNRRGKTIRAVLLTGLVATVFICLIVFALFKSPTINRMTVNVSDSCSASRSCADAREFLRSTIDTSYDPCSNFYNYVCGRWTNGVRTSDGYLDELLQALRTRIYDHLDDMKVSSDHCELPRAMSLFFKSCCDFMTRKNGLQRTVDSAIQAFGINSSAWETSKTLEGIFPDVIGASLITGVPSVLQVTYVTGTDISIHIDVGKTLAAIYERRLDSMLKTYLNDVVNIISAGFPAGEANFTALDLKFEKIYAQVQNATSNTMPARELQAPIPSSIWIQSINRHFPTSVITKDSLIYVRGFEAIRDSLRELEALTSRQRNTYLLLLVVSNVLTHDFKARFILNGTGEREECLRLTSRYFSRVFYNYVVQNFQLYGTEEMKAMAGYIGTIMSDRMRVSPWIPAARRNQVANAVREVRVSMWDLQAQELGPISYHFLTNFFLKNAVLLLMAHTTQHANVAWVPSLPWSRWQFDGTLGYVPEYKVIVVTSAIIQPDAFYDAPGTRLNYATVGALLAESFFLAGMDTVDNFPSGEEKKADALVCYQRRIAGMTGKAVASSREVKEAVALQLALNVTYDIQRRGQEASKKSDQMFFRRFCLTSCGSSSGHRRVLPGHIRCNLLLLGLQEFQTAFDCPVVPYPVPCERSLH